MPVAAQHVGEDEGVEAVVLVARGAIAQPQRLHLPAGDDHHLQPAGQQRVDHRPVAALDRHPVHASAAQPPDHRVQTGGLVLGLESLDHRPAGIHDADRVPLPGPVHPAEAGFLGQPFLPTVHVAASAVAPVGSAPAVRDVQPVAH